MKHKLIITDAKNGPLRLEASRICDRAGIDDPETMRKIYLSLVSRECMQQIQPYIDAKNNFLLASTIPQITVSLGDHAKIKYNSESINALVAETDEAIANIIERYRVMANGQK